MRCPHCLKLVKAPVPATQGTGEGGLLARVMDQLGSDLDQCPECDGALRDADGLEIRRIDVDYETRLATLDQRSWERLKKGTWIAVAISVIGAFPVLHWFAGPVMVVFNLVWARWAMAAPYRRYMGGARRIIVRWISRMAGLILVGLHGSFVLPLVPLLAGPVVFALLCALVWWYHRFHFQRERERLPILLIEKVLLVALILVFLVLVGIAVFLAIAFGEVLSMFNLGG